MRNAYCRARADRRRGDYYADSGRDPASGKTVRWGGLQDNGTSKLIEGADRLHPQEASEPFGGDGGDTIVDTTNADNVLTEYTDLAPAITNDGGRHWRDITPGDPNPLFIAPVVQDETVRAACTLAASSCGSPRRGSAPWRPTGRP